MPMVWVPNDIRREHHGVKVYYAYDNDCPEDFMLYHFCLSPNVSYEDGEYFDIRGWGGWKGMEESDFRAYKTFEDYTDDMIRKAIEAGDITQDGVSWEG